MGSEVKAVVVRRKVSVRKQRVALSAPLAGQAALQLIKYGSLEM